MLELVKAFPETADVMKILWPETFERVGCMFSPGAILVKRGTDVEEAKNRFILIHKTNSHEYGLRNMANGQSITTYHHDPSFWRQSTAEGGKIHIPKSFLEQHNLTMYVDGPER